MAEMHVTETVTRPRKLQSNASDSLASAVVTADCFFLSPRTEAKLGIIYFEIRRVAADLEAHAA